MDQDFYGIALQDSRVVRCSRLGEEEEFENKT